MIDDLRYLIAKAFAIVAIAFDVYTQYIRLNIICFLGRKLFSMRAKRWNKAYMNFNFYKTIDETKLYKIVSYNTNDNTYISALKKRSEEYSQSEKIINSIKYLEQLRDHQGSYYCRFYEMTFFYSHLTKEKFRRMFIKKIQTSLY